MRRLRSTDGTSPHRKAAQFHISKLRSGKAPLHATLMAEMTAKYDLLVAKSRECEDAEDAAVGAMADSEAAEESFEDIVRDTDGDLARLDRENPTLNSQNTVFPDGFGAIIEPDGDKQLEVIPALKVRLGQFKGNPLAAAAFARIEAGEAALLAAFAAEDKAVEDVDRVFTEEQEARREVREQFESAYGRLRDLYKSRPALVERFFQKELRGRRAEKKAPGAGGGIPSGATNPGGAAAGAGQTP